MAFVAFVHLGDGILDRWIARRSGALLLRIAGDGIGGKDDLLCAIAHGFAFPDYFGGNWDALDECITDLSWLEADDCVCLVDEAKALWRRHPALMAQLVDVWHDAAEHWRHNGRRLQLVFAM